MSRTTSSVTSVDTPDAFFGHYTHNIPSFFSAFLRAGKHPLQIGASIGEELDESVKNWMKSNWPLQLTDQDYAFGERPQGRVVICWRASEMCTVTRLDAELVDQAAFGIPGCLCHAPRDIEPVTPGQAP